MKQSYEDDTAEKIEAARREALERYNAAIRSANNDRKRGLVEEEELQNRIAAAAEEQYRTLENIAAEHNLIEGDVVKQAESWGETVRLNQEYQKGLGAEKERASIFVDQGDSLDRQAITRAKEAGLTKLAVELENQLIDKQRQREREALKASNAYILASDKEREKILANFDKITEGMKKIQKEAKETSPFDSDAYNAGLQIGQTALDAFSSIAASMTEITRIQAAEAVEEIDRMLEKTQEDIEKARTEALEAAGFIEATNSESIQAQIDAAIEANDEVLQYQLERRQKEMEINEQYDAAAKAAKEKAEREKAEIEYNAALKSWELQVAQAWATLPMTIVSAIAAGWKAGEATGIAGAAPALAAAYAAMAGASSKYQFDALNAAKPKMPKFADGGIVPGQPHGNTDTVMSMLTPGEVVLNRAQQENLAPQLGGGNLYIDLIYDGERVSQMVVENYINKGRVLIDASRGIR
jgi:hypothetical protein